MCAVGSSQETSIAAATPAGVGGSLRNAGGAQPGARRVAGGRSTMLGSAGGTSPGASPAPETPNRGIPRRGGSLLTAQY